MLPWGTLDGIVIVWGVGLAAVVVVCTTCCGAAWAAVTDTEGIWIIPIKITILLNIKRNVSVIENI